MKQRIAQNNTRHFASSLLAACLLCSGYLDTMALVTSDGFGTHIAEPGVSYFGISHDGVGEVMVDRFFHCTGALLEGGRHVLTAAHCVRADPLESEMAVRFTLKDGTRLTLEAETWQPHPKFQKEQGYDVGIIVLKEHAPVGITRYRLLRELGAEIGVPNYIFGFGLRGHGSTGKEDRDGRKRYGRNKYEATGENKDPNAMTLGGSDDERWIFSDFDSGLAENDAFGFHFNSPDLGYGDDEVFATNGDSGAAIFVKHLTEPLIAGTVSSGTRYRATPNADVDTLVNGTWGQFSVDTRTAAPESLEFFDSYLEQTLEASSIQAMVENHTVVIQLPASQKRYVYINYSLDLEHWYPFTSTSVSADQPTVLKVHDFFENRKLPKRSFFRAYQEIP